MGLGFIFMFFASVESEILKIFDVLACFSLSIYTIENIASLVILSYITKLSPKKIVASIMGIYFAAIGLGNKLAGTIGQSSEISVKKCFLGITIICIIVGLI